MGLTGVHVADGAGDASGGATGVQPGALTALLQEVAAAPERREEEPLSLPPGTVVGRFEIIRELGRGGFGVVYEAKDRDLGRQVAVKVVRPGRITEEEGKVSREAEAIARLAHPNLITLFEVGRSEHGPFLVFELLRGKTLDLRIEEGPLPVQEAVHIATEVARGLAHAHAEGVIHRDLKPANVFVTNKGQVKILDFGMAHAFGRRRLSGGTPAYMAPEQWEDAPEDERTDVFALGVMLYRMLTGEYPFPEGKGRWSSEPATVRKLDVPGAPELAELIEKMLEPTPTRRPRDGAAVLAVLTTTEDKLRARPADGSPPVHAKRRKATFGDLLAELRRRHVFRVMLGYGIFAFAVLQVTEPIMHGAHLPDWVLTAVLVGLVLGFPVAVVLAWVYDLTAHGVKRTPSSTDPGAPRFGRSRLLLPLAVAAVVLAIATVGAGGWYAWKHAPGNRSVQGTGESQSIAVLPFKDLSPNHDQEYFSDGISEEILSALSGVKGLRVPGRVSSFYFKGKDARLEDIGRELRVDHVLEGSVRRSGSRVRITAEVVKVETGERVWSQSFERELTDIFAMQDEISRAVTQALRVRLLPGQSSSPTEYRPANPEAYQSYLLGKHFSYSMSGDSQLRAIGALGKAVTLDPGYAQAWAVLARAKLTAGTLGEVAWGEARRDALAAASRAVELAPALPEVLASRAQARLAEWDWQGAKADIDRALEPVPTDPQASAAMASYLGWMGQRSERVEWQLRHVEKEPLDGVAWNALGAAYMGANRPDEAEKAFSRALEVDPRNEFARANMCLVLLSKGRLVEALAALPVGSTGGQCRARAHFALGQFEESQKALDAMLEGAAGDRLFYIARVYDYRGQTDLAIDWLERARGEHVRAMASIKYGWSSSLKSNPRYTALLRNMNLPVDEEPAAVSPSTAAPANPSIAVLPFADMSPKHDQEYFADGVAEEILNGLARVQGLKVIGRTSSFSFKGKSDDIKTIGQKLGVANVLEGSLRKSGGRLRITAQLVKAADGVHLWSQTFDRPAADVFAVQDEIARAVVDALKVRLVVPGGKVMPIRPTASLEAHNQYLLGLGFMGRGDSGEYLRSARDAFKRAIQFDPSFAPAWADLAVVLSMLCYQADDAAAMDATRKEAMAAAERAVELGPERPEGYRARAVVRQTIGFNWNGARRDLEKAMALNRGDARTVQEMGGLLFSTEGPTAAMPLLLTAVSIDPLSGSANRYLCGAYLVAGSFDNALKACERAVELSPDSVNSRAQFGEVLLLQGSPVKALEVFDRIPLEPYRLYGVALAQFSLGNMRVSDEALVGLVARWSHGWAYQIGEIYGWRGDKDRAFEWLERAFARRDGGLGNIKYDPFLRSLHGDPRFSGLLKKLNLPVD